MGSHRGCVNRRVQERPGQKAPSPVAGPKLAERKPSLDNWLPLATGPAPFLFPSPAGAPLTGLAFLKGPHPLAICGDLTSTPSQGSESLDLLLNDCVTLMRGCLSLSPYSQLCITGLTGRGSVMLPMCWNPDSSTYIYLKFFLIA